MLDELSIVWVLAVGYCVWLPETQFSCTNSRLSPLAVYVYLINECQHESKSNLAQSTI